MHLLYYLVPIILDIKGSIIFFLRAVNHNEKASMFYVFYVDWQMNLPYVQEKDEDGLISKYKGWNIIWV